MKNYKTAVFRSGDKIGKDYVCGKCSAGNRRLWRDSHTMLEALDLYCALCAEKDQAENIKKYAEYRHPDEHADSSFGNLVPARPTPEGDTFWGHSSGDVWWWYSLPQYPDDLVREAALMRHERNRFVREADSMGERWLKEQREHVVTRRERDEAYRIAKMHELPQPETHKRVIATIKESQRPPTDIVQSEKETDIRFATTAYVVDATSQEQQDIWWRWVHLYGMRYEQDSMGLWMEIGKVADRPVVVSISWGVFAGMFRIAFVDATSQLVDYALVEEWQKKAFPCLSGRAGGYSTHSDAMNFGNIVGDMRRRLGDRGLPMRDIMAVEAAAQQLPSKK